MRRITIYSALYGGYDEIPTIRPDIDTYSVLYVDTREAAHAAIGHGWREIRIVDHQIVTFNGDPKITAPMLAHKYWKMFAGFDESVITVWLDASMTITTPDFEQLCLDAVAGVDLALMKHPWRDCVYDEADYSAQLPRYESLKAEILAQSGFYRAIGHPASSGLHASGFYIRRNTMKVEKLMNDWWWECVTRSHQDQISLPVVLRLHPDIVHKVNLPWHDGPESWTHLGHHLK